MTLNRRLVGPKDRYELTGRERENACYGWEFTVCDPVCADLTLSKGENYKNLLLFDANLFEYPSEIVFLDTNPLA
jgi:hypothetical protein